MSGNRGLLTTATGLFGTNAVTAASGALFWVIAARVFEPIDVGAAGAALAAILLIARLGTMGLGTMLIGELATDRERAWRLTADASVTAAALTAGLALVVVVLWAAVGAGNATLSLLGAFLLVIGSSMTASGIVVDGALVGLLMGSGQLARNVIASLAKLAMLPALVALSLAGSADAIVLAAVAGTALSLAVVVAASRPTVRRWTAIRPVERALAMDALRHHGFNLALLAPAMLLPLLAPWVLGSEASGYFFIAFTIAGIVWAVPESFALALYAHGSGDSATLAPRIRYAARISLGVGLIASLLMLVAAGPILAIFGPAYAEAGAHTLRVLTLGVFPAVLLSLYVPIVRIDGRFARGTALTLAGTCAGLAAALLGASLAGMDGFALGWVAGTTIARTPMAMAVLRAARPPRVEAASDAIEVAASGR